MSDDVARDAIASNVDVAMVRPSLDPLPPVVIPAGYAIRAFAADDAELWRAIQAAADQYNDITPSLGHDGAYRTTSAARLTAIGLYASLGFSASPRTDEERDAWATIERAMAHR